MKDKIHLFKIAEEYLLGPDGTVNPNRSIDISDETLLIIYNNMLLTRAFDKKAVALQRTGKLGTFPSCYGQEAIYSAIAVAMHKDDVLCPYYRDHGALFYRGIPISSILKYWGGYGNDSAGAKNMPICVPIASQCLHAAGIAYSLKYKKLQRAALVTLGDGATSKGDFYEAMNFAGVHNLPIVFVINNNAWAISTPLEQQTKCTTLAQKAIAAEIEGITVDGNDAVVLYSKLEYALTKAYKGDGPTVIDAKTYRLCDHTTADNKLRYCPEEEIAKATQYEPLLRLELYLRNKKVLNDAMVTDFNNNVTAQITAGVNEYLEYVNNRIEQQ
jgi:2-oxoisovalerate dehydrogenase E1 component alpha subunit